MLRRTLGGGFLALAATLAAQAPAHPDFSGTWTFVKDPAGPALQAGVFGDRFTIEQGPTSLTMTLDFNERRLSEPAHLVQYRFTYPFNESDTAEPMCRVAKTGWDGPSLVIVTTMSQAAGCYSFQKQTKVSLGLDGDGRLVVEETATYKPGSAMATHVGGRVIPGDEPQVVWVNRYERAKR
jgi:hypothetical protein